MTFNFKYIRCLLSITLILPGTFLLVEHIYKYYGADLDDIIGHETLGIVLILLGILISARIRGEYLIRINKRAR